MGDKKLKLSRAQWAAIHAARSRRIDGKPAYTKRDIDTGFIIDPTIDHNSGRVIPKENRAKGSKPFFAPHGIAVHGWDSTCIACNKRGVVSPPELSPEVRRKEVRKFQEEVEIPNARRLRDKGMISDAELQRQVKYFRSI